MKNLIFVIYDGILNSVFEGQVLTPLLKKLSSDDIEQAYLISFEEKELCVKEVARLNNIHQKLHVIILKRNKFLITCLLFPEIRKLKKQLFSLERYEIIARGPIAGFISQRSLDPQKCLNLMVQARGLLAEEYKYEHRNAKGMLKYFFKWRENQYRKIESLGFKNLYNDLKNFSIEVVSDALQRVLEKEYGADAQRCILARDDVPAKIDTQTVKLWREQMRAKLKIPADAFVYCFSGAVKSWQCPHLVIDYFKKCYECDKRSFLLVLTFDVVQFTELLNKAFPKSAFYVISVPHDEIYQFLAAADKGMVFREKNIVSWISRPVKAMEYEAVGLPFIHNNTVDWVIENFRSE